MKVRLIIGTNAYAVIEHSTGCMDVLLNPGRSAQQSLRESALEDDAKARRLTERAAHLRHAAAILETQK